MCVCGMLEKYGDQNDEGVVMNASHSEGWDTVPLFPNLAKTTYGYGGWPLAVKGRSLYSCLFACICENQRERNESMKALFVCLCVCVHGWRLVYVHISVYPRVCATSWAWRNVFPEGFGVRCSGKRSLPPSYVSTELWISFRQRQMSRSCLLPPLFCGWV